MTEKESDIEKRTKTIRALLKSTKGNFLIEQPFFCDYGYHITIGENFYANHNLVILDATEITIGDNVFIGPNCGIYAAGHPGFKHFFISKNSLSIQNA